MTSGKMLQLVAITLANYVVDSDNKNKINADFPKKKVMAVTDVLLCSLSLKLCSSSNLSFWTAKEKPRWLCRSILTPSWTTSNEWKSTEVGWMSKQNFGGILQGLEWLIQSLTSSFIYLHCGLLWWTCYLKRIYEEPLCLQYHWF